MGNVARPPIWSPLGQWLSTNDTVVDLAGRSLDDLRAVTAGVGWCFDGHRWTQVRDTRGKAIGAGRSQNDFILPPQQRHNSLSASEPDVKVGVHHWRLGLGSPLLVPCATHAAVGGCGDTFFLLWGLPPWAQLELCGR